MKSLLKDTVVGGRLSVPLQIYLLSRGRGGGQPRDTVSSVVWEFSQASPVPVWQGADMPAFSGLTVFSNV